MSGQRNILTAIRDVPGFREGLRDALRIWDAMAQITADHMPEATEAEREAMTGRAFSAWLKLEGGDE